MQPWSLADEVDAEIVEDVPARGYGTVNQVRPAPGVTVIGQQAPPVVPPAAYQVPPGVDPQAFAQMLTSSSRGRALSLFIEVPVLAYVALHPGINGLVRLGAAALGVYRVAQVVGQPSEYELQITTPEPG